MKPILTLTRLLLLLLLTSLLARAQQPVPLELGEEKDLSNLTQVSIQEHLLTVRGVEDELGWTQLEILRCELNSKTMFLVRSVSEIADLIRGRIREIKQTSLWTEQCELLVARYGSRHLMHGAESVDIEYRWSEETLWSKQGKERKREVSSPGRPVMEFPGLVSVRGVDAFAVGAEIELIELDFELGTTGVVTITRGEPTTLEVDDESIETTPFESSFQGGSSIYIDDAGEMVLLEVERMKVSLSRNDYGQALARRLVASNSNLLAAAIGRARSSWVEKRGRWSNADIGLNFKAPKKKWQRSTSLHDNQVFQFTHDSGEAVLVISIEPVGNAYTLDSYVEALAGVFSETEGISGVETSEGKLAKRPALRVDYVNRVGDIDVQCSLLACFDHGLAYQVSSIQGPGVSRSVVKELVGMVRSMRLVKN